MGRKSDRLVHRIPRHLSRRRDGMVKEKKIWDGSGCGVGIAERIIPQRDIHSVFASNHVAVVTARENHSTSKPKLHTRFLPSSSQYEARSPTRCTHRRSRVKSRPCFDLFSDPNAHNQRAQSIRNQHFRSKTNPSTVPSLSTVLKRPSRHALPKSR